MSFKLTLDFATDADRDSFIGWFLDGGGEQEFNGGREANGESWLQSDGPGGGDWEWPTASATKPVLDNYTIEMRADLEDQS